MALRRSLEVAWRLVSLHLLHLLHLPLLILGLLALLLLALLLVESLEVPPVESWNSCWRKLELVVTAEFSEQLEEGGGSWEGR